MVQDNLETILSKEKTDSNRLKIARTIIIASIVSNLILAALKITVSIIFNAVSLLADGLDSALDIIMTSLSLVALQISNEPADEEHHFGHDKVENLFAIATAVLLVISSGVIGYQAIEKLVAQEIAQFQIFKVIVAGASIIIKGVLAWLNLHFGKKLNSQVLQANGYNFRTDLLMSAAVLISVSIDHLSINGFSLFWVDPALALIISVLIVLTAIKISKKSVNVLLDTSPEPEIQEKIIEHLESHPKIRKANNLRARFVGECEIFADVNIYVDPKLTIEDGDSIAAEAEKRVKEELPVKYLIIHVEPFKD